MPGLVSGCSSSWDKRILKEMIAPLLHEGLSTIEVFSNEVFGISNIVSKNFNGKLFFSENKTLLAAIDGFVFLSLYTLTQTGLTRILTLATFECWLRILEHNYSVRIL